MSERYGLPGSAAEIHYLLQRASRRYGLPGSAAEIHSRNALITVHDAMVCRESPLRYTIQRCPSLRVSYGLPGSAAEIHFLVRPPALAELWFAGNRR